MIEINLLPRAGKKKSRRPAGPGFAAMLGGFTSKVRDPYLSAAVVCLLAGGAAIAGLHLNHVAKVDALTEAEQQAVQDSTRYAAILKEKYEAEAQRDSILRQLDIIKSIDNDRFVWPHIMEEVSRALPAYTWLTNLQQTSAVVSRAAVPVAGATDTATVGKPTPLQFRIVGQTVDIQALTRFMKLLESSDFIENVQLVKSDATELQGATMTQFELAAQYEIPPASAIRMIPVTLSVR